MIFIEKTEARDIQEYSLFAFNMECQSENYKFYITCGIFQL